MKDLMATTTAEEEEKAPGTTTTRKDGYRLGQAIKMATETETWMDTNLRATTVEAEAEAQVTAEADHLTLVARPAEK